MEEANRPRAPQLTSLQERQRPRAATLAVDWMALELKLGQLKWTPVTGRMANYYNPCNGERFRAPPRYP